MPRFGVLFIKNLQADFVRQILINFMCNSNSMYVQQPNDEELYRQQYLASYNAAMAHQQSNDQQPEASTSLPQKEEILSAFEEVLVSFGLFLNFLFAKQ